MPQDRVVNVYNWSDYIDSSILDDFTKETGIKVVYDTYDSNEILETKLLAGGSGYDIVVPIGQFPRTPDPGRRVPEARQVEAAEPLQHVGRRDPSEPRKYDPGNEYSINYMWGTVGIGYNIKKVAGGARHDKIDSWDVFFNPESLAKFEGLRRLCAGFAGRHDAGRAEISRPRSEQHVADDLAKAEEASDEDPALHPQVPFVRIHQCAGQRRNLPGGRLFGRHVPGPRPRGRSRAGRRHRLLGPEGRRANVVRPDGDPGRCAACRRGA